MNKKLAILIAIGIILFGGVILLKTGNIGTTALWNLSGEGKFLLPLVGIAALKAQGLMLSIKAAMPTSGSRNLPSPLKFQSAVVPMLPVLRRITHPNSIMPIAIRIANFLFMELLPR